MEDPPIPIRGRSIESSILIAFEPWVLQKAVGIGAVRRALGGRPNRNRPPPPPWSRGPSAEGPGGKGGGGVTWVGTYIGEATRNCCILIFVHWIYDIGYLFIYICQCIHIYIYIYTCSIYIYIFPATLPNSMHPPKDPQAVSFQAPLRAIRFLQCGRSRPPSLSEGITIHHIWHPICESPIYIYMILIIDYY